MNWNEYFLKMALLVAEKSKDPSTKVGVVIVGPDNEIRSTGFNGFPRGVDDFLSIRYERPIKYLYTEHAERNAIYNAARIGTRLKDCTLYINYLPYHICPDCSRAIIQSGITKIIGTQIPLLKPENMEKWKDSFLVSEKMLSEADVTVVKL